MARQQALKASIEVLNNSKKETNMSLKVKNPATQVLSPTALKLVSRVGGGHLPPVGTGTPPHTILFGRVFADT